MCLLQIADGWQYGEFYDEDERLHPSLLEFVNLRSKVVLACDLTCLLKSSACVD